MVRSDLLADRCVELQCKPAAQLAAIRDDIRIIALFQLEAFQHGGKIAIARLAEAMVENYRTDRGKVDPHPRQHPEESRLHHRSPVEDAMLDALADQELD